MTATSALNFTEGDLSHSASKDRLLVLHQAIDRAAHLLPAQGPITVFIHHNTLHAFEDLPFDEAVQRGAKLFGCQPYLPEERYRQMLAGGRIRLDDLSAALLANLGDYADALLGFLGTRFHFRLSMLQHPVRLVPAAELRWFVAETDALKRFREEAPPQVRQRFVARTRHWVMRDLLHPAATTFEPAGNIPHDRAIYMALDRLIDHFGRSSIERWSDADWEAFSLQALWRICHNGVHGVTTPSAPHAAAVRHRDLLLEATGSDADALVHEALIRFCSAFLDQGLAQWPLPLREEGLFRSFCALYRQAAGPPDSWLYGLKGEIARLDAAGTGPLESILESLDLLGVGPPEWESYITQTLLALRGWGGMIHHLESRPDRVAHPPPPGSVMEFLAVRLVLERLALAHLARESLGYTAPLAPLRDAVIASLPRHTATTDDQRAFLVFQTAQVLQWLPGELVRLSKQEWSILVDEMEAFTSWERRRVFHAAFERRYRVPTLDAISIHASNASLAVGSGLAEEFKVRAPRFQVVTCLDEREESFRRHLEEIEPAVETFGVAGFFNVAMYYRGAADAHFVPSCPIIIQPKHWVVEDVALTDDELHDRRVQALRTIATTSHRFHLGTRTLAGGALIAGLGALAAIPLVARVLFPRLTAQIRRFAGRLVQPPSRTRLQLERGSEAPGQENGCLGFSLDERTAISERLLRDIGLTANFARLVVLLGHGSHSLNNPHNSAYNCGACGGGSGGPNARAAAQMLNDRQVRQRLAAQGIHVPDDTCFVGGFHNTCSDEVAFLDVDQLPDSHQDDFDHVQTVVDQTSERNAHERCRRFMSAALTLSASAAKRHVEARAEDLAQTRPELGHATNALCIVARRQRTRGLFMDRRAFLASYDPTQDDASHSILGRILQAAVPVCAGINLEYYFSHVDPAGWGCGTKLPHNITSLLGVMDGAASDLRTGLPWQMVEIHEPVRLLFVIETTPEAMLSVMERNEEIARLCRNEWIQLATLTPGSSQIHLFRGGRFEPYTPETTALPQVTSSVDWYRGWRDHLGFAEVGAESGLKT